MNAKERLAAATGEIKKVKSLFVVMDTGVYGVSSADIVDGKCAWAAEDAGALDSLLEYKYYLTNPSGPESDIREFLTELREEEVRVPKNVANAMIKAAVAKQPLYVIRPGGDAEDTPACILTSKPTAVKVPRYIDDYRNVVTIKVPSGCDTIVVALEE